MRLLTVLLSLIGVLFAACASSKTPPPAKAGSDAARAVQTPDASVDDHSPPGDYPAPGEGLDQPD